MMIVTCPKCKKLIHKADKCLYCGNAMGFQPISESVKIHENVAAEYSELPILLASGKYGQLVETSRIVLRWMPTCSTVFWMRLLAKNNCKTDAELIQKGVSCDDAADFYNAYRYGTPSEKIVYEQVKELIERIRTEFEMIVVKHEYEEKAATPIVRCQSKFATELQSIRDELFGLWTRLEKIEQEMHVIEQDCKLLINEHKISLNSSKNEAIRIKAKSYNFDECTSEELHKYLVHLGNILNQSDACKKEIDLMRKQLPWLGAFNSKVQEREDIIGQISLKISELHSYENRVKSTVSEIEKIEKKHQLVLRNLTDYEFRSIYSLLGAKKYEEILNSAGLVSISNSTNVAQGLFDN